jgi:hypothetical protein
MLTIGACMSLRGEHKYNEIYVFVYAPAARLESSSYVFRDIFEKLTIAMTNFIIRE